MEKINLTLKEIEEIKIFRDYFELIYDYYDILVEIQKEKQKILSNMLKKINNFMEDKITEHKKKKKTEIK